MIPILMHQVRIGMIRPKKLEIRKNCENYRRALKNQTECHKIEPNPLKDRAMHEEDDPSFQDEFIQFFFRRHEMTEIMISNQFHTSYRKCKSENGRTRTSEYIRGGIRCHGGVSIPC
jgi:hypothetical protein